MSGRAVLAALALLSGAFTASSQVSAADPYGPQISNLRVVGDTGTWTAATSFKLQWSLYPSDPNQIAGVRLRLLGGPLQEELEAMEMVPTGNLLAGNEMAREVEIPDAPGEDRAAPGIYTVEVWARSGEQEGPRHLATLRVDNRQPGPAVPHLDAAWFRADVPPLLRIAGPAGPLPSSGIRGYAVSLRREQPQPPCAGPDRCSLEELDLFAGSGGGAIPLGLLPEGVHFASVVAVSGTGMRSKVVEAIPVRIDGTRPELVLDGADGGWSNHPVRVAARASDPLSGMQASGPNGPLTVISVDGAAPTVAQGGEAAAIVSGSGVHSVTASARDAAGNIRGGDGASPLVVGVVKVDEAAPTVAFVRAGDPGDPELLEAVVNDPLSGPAALVGSIGVRPLGSERAFEPLPTTSVDGRLRARWDSDSYPHGSYEFGATGYDVAGNATSSTRRGNGTAVALVNPVKVPSAVRFGFGGRRLVWHRCVRSGEGRRCRREVIEAFGLRPATRLVPYGRGVQVGGQAVTASGAPLAGVVVELVESFDVGAVVANRVTRLQTAADGRFYAWLAAGPSRRVEAHFGGSRLHTRASSRALRLGVRSSVRLRASSAGAEIGGKPVVFSGRIARAGATVPAYGRPIQLQFRLPGSEWTEFRTVQTDALGRFRLPYSFSDDDSRGVRFLFRAYAPPQPGWPYEPAVSRPVSVTGH